MIIVVVVRMFERSFRHAISAFCALCRSWPIRQLLLLVFQLPLVQAEESLTRYRFEIPEGPAAQTLTIFGRQAKWQVLFDRDALDQITTQPLNEELDVDEGLRRLLIGTGLDPVLDRANRTITIDVSGAHKAHVPPPPPILSVGTFQIVRKHAESGRTAVSSSPTEGTPEILVETGTQIPGDVPDRHELQVIDGDRLRQSGFSTAADVLNQLPMFFRGGPSQNLGVSGNESETNVGAGTGANLRGLGAGATLVLLDGRRLAPSGGDGDFVDISNISLTAIDRVEILTNGASAVYGSDAIAGVVNFITRSAAAGTQTRIELNSVTEGTLRESTIGQLIAARSQSGTGILSLEYEQRTSLLASDRTFVNSDLTANGGPDLDTPYSNPATVRAGSQTWAVPHGQDGSSWSTRLQPGTQNLENIYLDTDAFPAQQHWSALGNWRQQINDRFAIAVHGLWSHRLTTEQNSGQRLSLSVPSTNPFYAYPSGASGPLVVEYNLGKDLGPQITPATVTISQLGLDLEMDLSDRLRATVSINDATEKDHQVTFGKAELSLLNASLANSSPLEAFNPFGDGSHTAAATLRGIQQLPWFDTHSELDSVRIALSGTLFEWSAGPVKEAFGFEARRQFFSTTADQSVLTPAADYDYQRHLSASFAELRIPFFGATDSDAGPQMLVTAAGRYEKYSDFGGSFSPLGKILWSPGAGFKVTGTAGESFRAPSLVSLDVRNNGSVITPLADASSPTGVANALVASGGNASLRAEHAWTRTLGMSWSSSPQPPSALVQLGFFDVHYTGRIQSGAFRPDILNDPGSASLVIRHPTPALRDEICHSGQFDGQLATCENEPIAAIVDLRLLNIDSLLTRGVDFQAQLEVMRLGGILRWKVNGTYTTEFTEVPAPSVPGVRLLDTLGNPLALRILSSLQGEWHRAETSLDLNYQNAYSNTQTTPASRIASWTTIDAHASYHFPRDTVGFLEGMEIGITVKNVSNRPPPFAINVPLALGWDPANADVYNRTVRIYLEKCW